MNILIYAALFICSSAALLPSGWHQLLPNNKSPFLILTTTALCSAVCSCTSAWVAYYHCHRSMGSLCKGMRFGRIDFQSWVCGICASAKAHNVRAMAQGLGWAVMGLVKNLVKFPQKIAGIKKKSKTSHQMEPFPAVEHRFQNWNAASRRNCWAPLPRQFNERILIFVVW